MSTTVAVTTTPASPARPRAEVLRRADGIELIGEFEGSGFKKPPRLARRSDGQVVQLTHLLFAVAEAADGRRDLHAVAEVVSRRCGRPVNAANVKLLAEKKLRPLGILTLPDGSTPKLTKRPPVMALRYRKPLLSERLVNFFARPFVWLHRAPVVTMVLTAIAGFDVWLFGYHGVAGPVRAALYNPTLLLAVLASVVVATAFHEFGHASACRYGGARPGVMGVGLYLVWPAFYCDVTDAYRLNRAGRLRTDLGGVYFNGIFALLAGGVYLATGQEAALLAAIVQHIILLQQLLPLMRFDGYYVLTDLTGVPDILSRIKPIFRSLVPGRSHEPRVAELKPWVRVVVTAYLALLLPALAFLFAWMVMGVPRIAATVHDSFGLQLDRIGAAATPSEAGVGVVRVLMLVMPVGGMTLSTFRATRMAGRGLNRWSQGSLPRRVVAILVAGSLLGAVGYVWWPNGDYEPIRPGERGTIGEALSQIPDAPGGRPAWTPERELTYAPVATVRQVEAARAQGLRSARPARQAPALEWLPSRPAGPAHGRREESVDHTEQPFELGEDGLPWPDSPDPGGQDGKPSGGATYDPVQNGTWTQPGGTAPAPAGTTTTEPTSDPGTTTTPAPTDTTSTTPTEPAPTTTDTTTAAPPPDSTTPTTTETTPTTTDTAPTTTETAPTTTDTTETAPTLTDPTTTDTTTTDPTTTTTVP